MIIFKLLHIHVHRFLYTLPTRFANRSCSLIDQVYCKLPLPVDAVSSRIVVTQLSDHLPWIISIIMTCSKYNAHTDPIFKKLKLLKIQDIFNVQNLKIYYKYKIAKLPQYFMTMFTINADIHPFGTRQSSHLHHGITRTTTARKCIGYLLPILIDNTSQDIIDKVGTHSIEGFSF